MFYTQSQNLGNLIKSLVIVLIVLLGSVHAFGLTPQEEDAVAILFTYEFTPWSTGTSGFGERAGDDRDKDLMNALVVNAQEIYEATGVTEQELLIQLMQEQE